MKIYTKKGDSGQTRLIDGEPVPKNHIRLEACGDLDELNTLLGMLILKLPHQIENLITDIQEIQRCLIAISARIADPQHRIHQKKDNRNLTRQTEKLEKHIDQMQSELPELQSFILPGGHASACWAHLARTQCRRSERRIVRFISDINNKNDFEDILQYINRLSDYLFVLARFCNLKTGTPDTYE